MSIATIEKNGQGYVPFEKHTAESRWQFCNCQSCQDYRRLIERMPGKPIDFKTYRHKDEKY